MEFSSIFIFSSIINLISALVFGFVVLTSNWKKTENRLFFLFTFSLAVWSTGYYFWLNAHTENQAHFWIGILNIGSTLMPVFYYHWVVSILKLKRKWLLIIAYFLSIIFSLFSFSSLYFDGYYQVGNFNYWPRAGFLYPIFIMILYGGLFSMGICDSIRTFFIKKEKRKIIWIILWVYFLAWTSGATNFFLWFGINIWPFGNFLVFIYVLLISYAMFHYNLMNMKIASVKIAITFIVGMSFFQIFVSEDILWILIRIFVFLTSIFYSYHLIKSYQRDVQRKEELQTMADDLASANQRLKKLDQAKSEFISIASHQLRTPLTAIKGFISLILEDSYGKVDKGVRGALNKVYLSNERLIQLVEDLLSISRIESGRLEYNFRKWDMQEIVEDVVDMFRLRAREVGLDLKTKLPQKGLLPKVVIDGNKIREVISNLIDNALKYTQSGYVEISVMKRNGAVVVAIQDSGIGVRSEDLPYLFQKFSRGKDMSRLHANGTGLGLYVGRQIIEAHKGKLYVVSEGEGKGSTFYIEIPIDGLEESEDKN